MHACVLVCDFKQPDGSSFPSGGLRATHVARGYTAWDPHSPPFVLQSNNGACLYIPSCFFSWDQSYALDEKIPLLRSEVALARESMRLFAVLEETKHTRVHMDAGLEQEFFLIDREYFMKRPDLMVGIAKSHTRTHQRLTMLRISAAVLCWC
jgi:glutamine synthetase